MCSTYFANYEKKPSKPSGIHELITPVSATAGTVKFFAAVSKFNSGNMCESFTDPLPLLCLPKGYVFFLPSLFLIHFLKRKAQYSMRFQLLCSFLILIICSYSQREVSF